MPAIVCGAKSFRAFHFVRSCSGLFQSSAVLQYLMGVLGNEFGDFRQNHPEVVQDCVRASTNAELDFHPLRFSLIVEERFLGRKLIDQVSQWLISSCLIFELTYLVF